MNIDINAARRQTVYQNGKRKAILMNQRLVSLVNCLRNYTVAYDSAIDNEGLPTSIAFHKIGLADIALDREVFVVHISKINLKK